MSEALAVGIHSPFEGAFSTSASETMKPPKFTHTHPLLAPRLWLGWSCIPPHPPLCQH